MQLELKSARGTLHLLGVESAWPHITAQQAVATTAMRRGDVFRVMDADKPAWQRVSVQLLTDLPTAWSAHGCSPIKQEFTQLGFLIPLRLTEG